MDSFLCHGDSSISIVFKYKGYFIYNIWIKYNLAFNYFILPDTVISYQFCNQIYIALWLFFSIINLAN